MAVVDGAPGRSAEASLVRTSMAEYDALQLQARARPPPGHRPASRVSWSVNALPHAAAPQVITNRRLPHSRACPPAPPHSCASRPRPCRRPFLPPPTLPHLPSAGDDHATPDGAHGAAGRLHHGGGDDGAAAAERDLEGGRSAVRGCAPPVPRQPLRASEKPRARATDPSRARSQRAARPRCGATGRCRARGACGWGWSARRRWPCSAAGPRGCA